MFVLVSHPHTSVPIQPKYCNLSEVFFKIIIISIQSMVLKIAITTQIFYALLTP